MTDQALLSPFARPNSYIGRTVSRTGAKRAVAGRGRYTDDISLPRMVHAAFVRSPYAHAEILDIDVAAAAAQPRVVLVMTGAELAGRRTGRFSRFCSWGSSSIPYSSMANGSVEAVSRRNCSTSESCPRSL